ncbi:TetR/AcrR family transcriptional repressor of nem operon [Bradyrhizobium sp. USDA 4454]
MARPREFDEEVVLDAAMNQFWSHGYERTSVRDLADQMGITAASLYNAFGDKRSLYVLSLKYYLERRSRERTKIFDRSPAVDAIESYFRDVVRTSVGDKSQRGCMLVNAALETVPDDTEFQDLVAREFSSIESSFFRCVKAGQADKSLRSDIKAVEAAKMLLSVLLGLRVLARTRPHRSIVEAAARSAVDAIRA